ncbi:LEAF RUST 10 DISEASE-RESISTANCE LOCUS RECEPTOR-LIKE PROTEIN KINASE-like 1.1 isoform X2 [Solanum dulcamara]|uniref:LEAF RUST 10 DISEASE-RESISTANCE LOCUS RECEPTOR-LIKE PROTEIN KINASE-like 1.1 isoform X2 n=1 Tax=Solanum dulcamara TaxID=45834 RepID=UPI002486C7C0|nr:LEAF RUST 10 DISEASE-RESISTANCE LOCUS RECEPTOR-LIKE PROTEIN KINASE-like 1.1 isoform X2 [Solanum dulcamara]XP_055809656.1 LEAF RUST 10 DISEASE-RESISTANCE LOCUS RECEPTOR-LIKE PROTEIN KINASE-like 1.1 isoform X2 [Solanum dulcamara]
MIQKPSASFHLSCNMDFSSSLICFLLSLFLILVRAKGKNDSTCPKSFSCGNLTDLSFPFSLSTQPDCGIMFLSGCDAKPYPRIQLLPGGDLYYALGIWFNYTVLLGDPKLYAKLRKHKCQAFNKTFSLPDSPSISFKILNNLNFFKCNITSTNTPNITHKNDHFAGYRMYNECKGFSISYKLPGSDDGDVQEGNLPANCSLISLPINSTSDVGGLFNMLSAGFLVEWKLSEDCYQCHYGRGQCQTDITNKFHCTYPNNQDAKTTRRKFGLTLGAVFGGLGLVMICFAVYFIWCYKKRKFSPSHFLSTKKFSDIFKHDIEGGSIYFGVPVFSYSELEDATNDFNSSRVLGDGGFGTVYYGKLKDGREVAVKRLYEHNCKRMQQFVNEIEILTRLRHNNLVTLYGCTSRRSRELLLVYEYIPNGTLADHLHGDRVKDGSLAWPVRMNIAIETAGALAYLHASDVIHCDVKTNNILLDHNFSVKVADFGISQLFPNDVSHISTAPRGTPGYIDPKYHECYQLTSKSDVYSFGVVLVELISSMPAVDMSRHSQEINLANFAINKIVKGAFNELINPSLGFDSDTKIWEMTTSVAELAFLCLQTDRDIRPTMVEVLDTLKEIQTSEFGSEKRTQSNLNENEAKIVASSPFPESEDMLFLKKVKSLPSPNSVTDKWITCSDITTTKLKKSSLSTGVKG